MDNLPTDFIGNLYCAVTLLVADLVWFVTAGIFSPTADGTILTFSVSKFDTI